MEFFIILCCLVISSIVGSSIGFGTVLILISLLSFWIDVRTAVILASFWNFVLTIFNALKYRHYFDKSYWKKCVATGIPGIILGSFLIAIAPIQWIEMTLGLFVLAYVFIKIKEMVKNESLKRAENGKELIENNKSLPDIAIFAGGFTYGFLGGLIGGSGPINVILLERTGHEKESFIGNFAMTSITMTIFQLSVYIGNDLFPVEFLSLFLIGLPIIFTCSFIGHKLTTKIPKRTFQLIIMLLLLIISLRFIFSLLFTF